jgi:hypothetical protein
MRLTMQRNMPAHLIQSESDELLTQTPVPCNANVQSRATVAHDAGNEVNCDFDSSGLSRPMSSLPPVDKVQEFLTGLVS